MAKKRQQPGARRQREVRERLEGERQTAIEQLRALGIAPDSDRRNGAEGDYPRDEGDHAQASERQDLSAKARERLAERINRLSAALERLANGTYGQCEMCGGEIEPPRLAALPVAMTCLACQRERERVA